MDITRTSLASGITRTRDIPVTQEQLERWQQGGLIQDVMPELSVEDREFIQSGMTLAEWEQIGLEDDLDDPMRIVELGDWHMQDDGRTETRVNVGQDGDGYHYAVETSLLSGSSETGWSSETFVTPEDARNAGYYVMMEHDIERQREWERGHEEGLGL